MFGTLYGRKWSLYIRKRNMIFNGFHLDHLLIYQWLFLFKKPGLFRSGSLQMNRANTSSTIFVVQRHILCISIHFSPLCILPNANQRSLNPIQTPILFLFIRTMLVFLDRFQQMIMFDDFVGIGFVQNGLVLDIRRYWGSHTRLVDVLASIHRQLYQFYQLSKSMKYTLYNLQFIEYKNLMKQGKEAEYSHKMISIECKFKFICQNYEKVLKEMHNKNQMIEGLNSKIMDLQNQLQQSHYYTQELELKIQKMQALQRSSSNKYIKSNMLVPGKMEYQNMDVKNMLQKQNIQGIDSNVSIKDQLHVAYNRFNHMSSSKSQPKSKEIIQQQKSRELLNEEEGFSKRLEQLKFRIGTQSQLLTKKHHSFKDITNSLQKSSKNLHRKAQAQNNGSLTLLKNKDILENEWIEGQQKSKTLHKIWQQRDSEIFRMDEIFESINDKLKQYEH